MALRQCLSTRGLAQLVAALNHKLIELGYATTHVSLPAQNLARGRLVLQLNLGRVAEVRMVQAGHTPHVPDTRWGTWRNAFSTSR